MFVNDACLVVCPGENAWLDPSGTEWVLSQADAGTFARKWALELSLAVEWPYGRRHVTIWATNICACCGKHPHQAKLQMVDRGPPAQWRCEQHLGRNPCAVTGCARTRDGKRPRLDGHICGRHWRPIPKAMKRVHSRVWRLARKSEGWTDRLIYREKRIWGRLCSYAQNCVHGGGHLDLAAIEREFGI